MPSKRKPLVDKKGIIDLETAKQRFHDYYNNRSKSKIGRLRAKMFDIKYQKKPKYLLKPGEPGSAKYLLEEGPRSFDMEGVDYFPEGTTVDIYDPEYDNVSLISSGSTFKRDDTDDPDELEKIYGPRIKNTKRLYSKHFGDKLSNRRSDGDLKNKNLIEIYWEKYRQDPSRFRRKNKRPSEVEVDLVEFTVGDDIYLLSREGFIYNIEGEFLDDLKLNGDLEEIKDDILGVLINLELIDEVTDDIYDINQNEFRTKLSLQKIQRGNISISRSTPTTTSTPSLISSESSSKTSSKETTKSTPFKRLNPSISSSKKSLKEPSEDESLEISLEEPSEDESLEISLEEPSEEDTSKEEVEEEPSEDELDINPGLNIDKSNGKKYFIDVTDDQTQLIIYNENKSIKVGTINIENIDISDFRKLGINANKLELLSETEESESSQSGGTYYDEVSLDEHELNYLEKLAGLR